MFHLLYLIPKNLISRLIGCMVNLNLGPWPVRYFQKHYNINMEEAEYPLSHYKNIASLFTRKLKKGVRPVESNWVHPVDAVIRNHGRIEQNTLLQAKGKTYKLEDLLQDASEAKDFEGAYYVTYYLCPTDYHRIHSPCEGNIYKSCHIPGALWPVNDWSIQNIRHLFSVNERIISYISNEWGKIASIKIGATNVGKITLSYDSDQISNLRGKTNIYSKVYKPTIAVKTAEEIGCFHMGSTVVLLISKEVMQKGHFAFQNGPCKLGEKWNQKK